MSTFSQEKYGTFEWILRYDDVKKFLKDKEYNYIDISPNKMKALVIGCGTSSLSYDFQKDLKVDLVVSIDNDINCIHHMNRTYADNDNLRWYYYDIIEDLDKTQNNELDNDGYFHLIIDKVCKIYSKLCIT